MKRHTLVLLSGGIDSSTILAQCVTSGAEVAATFIDYGQAAARTEWDAAQRIARHYGVCVRRLQISADLVSSDGEVFGRNAVLVMLAAATTHERPLEVAIGIHALSAYYDTTPLFARHVTRLLDGYSGGTVTLSAPFLTETKSDIIEAALASDLPLELTYSCETGNAPACLQCPSCLDRRPIDSA